MAIYDFFGKNLVEMHSQFPFNYITVIKLKNTSRYTDDNSTFFKHTIPKKLGGFLEKYKINISSDIFFSINNC